MKLRPCQRCLHNPLHCIIPPYMLENMAESSNAATRALAVSAIEASADARATRRFAREMPAMAAVMAPDLKKQRLIYDAQKNNISNMPGKLVRREGDEKHKDAAVNEAYDNSGTTYDFYLKRFARNSLDGKGMTIVSSVHVGKQLNNAFWNGRQMAYGDGDGSIFTRFTQSLDVVGHELTHGVVAHECNLEYRGESGALNEHFADVFGSLVSQWKNKQSAATATWRIGQEIMGPGSKAKSLRTFTAEKAFENDPNLGSDQQPKHMRNLYRGLSDNGGVHLNSGIPNHAFYLFAKAVGGNAWEIAGGIWYEAMRKLSSTSDFSEMARTTQMIAQSGLLGDRADRSVATALRQAWKAVGL
jgi:Zn-dependent metalloprotease